MNYHTDIANKLPKNILFGTSSWTYPGWQGSIYQDSYKDEKDLKARCLSEYSKFPWFRTVGIDSSFYGPLRENTIERYASMVPKDFCWVSKVWEQITVPVFPKHKRYGKKAGLKNSDFLNPALFIETVLAPYKKSSLEHHAGPFVFQFQHLDSPFKEKPEIFFEKLNYFLKNLPEDFQYAVEIRNKEFLNHEYFNILNSNAATHCFNHWSYMPGLKSQMLAAASAGGLKAPFYVSRLLTPLGLNYKQAVSKFQPYKEISKPNMEMRSDIGKLIKRAIKKSVKTYIIVNNRSEGHSPGTISEIGKETIRSL